MSDHPPVSVVILAWNAWEETKACLESLFGTLGPRDEVVVVDNGSSDSTPERLSDYPWVRVLRNDENRGFAAGCNQGAAVATRDLLIFLNNDTVLAGGWIGSLVEPFRDSRVAATGPRSNFVSGPQLVPEPGYAVGDHAGLERFVEAWSSIHRGKVSETSRLVGFCLAVRSSSFHAIGGFDEGYEIGGYEDDDLCRRLVDAGGSVLIAHASFVHHTGHRTFDANGVNWAAQEIHNRQRYLQKFAVDEPERTVGEAEAALGEARMLLEQGEATLAADRALALATDPEMRMRWLPAIVDVLAQVDGSLDRLVGLVGRDELRAFLGGTLALDPSQSDQLLESCVTAMPKEPAVLAAASSLAVKLPVERAIVWSTRIRAAGFSEACPLVADAMRARSCVERARAAASAVRMFADERGRVAFRAALDAAAPDDRRLILTEVAAICPELSESATASNAEQASLSGQDRTARGAAPRGAVTPGGARERTAFVIHAPWPFSNRSAGIRALYVLGANLVDRGAEVAISPLGCDYAPDPDPHGLPLVASWCSEKVEEAVHVYPEIVPGNPAGARKVARWYLGPARHPATGDELEVTWLPHLRPGADRLLVNVIDLDVFAPRAGTRSGALVWFGKCPLRAKELPAGFREITHSWPVGRAELAEELGRAEMLVSFDAFSAMLGEATLCGTPVLLAGDSPSALVEDTVFGTFGIAKDLSGLAKARRELVKARENYLAVCETMSADVDRFLERAGCHWS